MSILGFTTRLAAVFVAAAALGAAAAHAGPYTAIYAFGDSLSDVGNDYMITNGLLPARATPSSPPKPLYSDGSVFGRFTNGANYLDVLAAKLGVGMTASLAGGTNYAYGGARTAYVNPGVADLGAKSFNQQVNAYTAGLVSANANANANALYVLWIGANDMADAIGATAGGDKTAIPTAITTAMEGIGGAIGALATLGAQHFLVPNLPDLSLTPLIAGFGDPTLSQLTKSAVDAFNASLAGLLASPLLDPLDARELDTFAALNDLIANASAAGIANTTAACWTGEVTGGPREGGPANPTLCASPNSYVFLDYEHPTAAVHAVLGNLAYAATVPEPQGLALVALAAAALATRRRGGAPAPTAG